MADTQGGHHVQFWTGVRDHAANELARIAREPCPKTETEVVDLLKHIYACGSCSDKAEATVAVAEWRQAQNELDYKTHTMTGGAL